MMGPTTLLAAMMLSPNVSDESSALRWLCESDGFGPSSQKFEIIVPTNGHDMMTLGLDQSLEFPTKWGSTVITRLQDPTWSEERPSLFYTVDSKGVDWKNGRAKIMSMFSRKYRKIGDKYEYVSSHVGGSLMVSKVSYKFDCIEHSPKVVTSE